MQKLKPYRFCPVCSTKFEKKKVGLEQDIRNVCPKCDYVMYVNSSPTSNAVILNSENELLLTKRAIKPAIGKWDFAGGFLNNNENPVDGLKREIKEELGVDCTVGDFVNVHVSLFPSLWREAALNMYYYVKLKKGKIIAMSDVAEVRWFPVNEIKESMMSYAGNWKIVQQVKKSLRGR